jgi:hypothetical protein
MNKSDIVFVIFIIAIFLGIGGFMYTYVYHSPVYSTPPTVSASTQTPDFIALSCSQLDTQINQYMNNRNYYYAGNGLPTVDPVVEDLIAIYYGNGCAPYG